MAQLLWLAVMLAHGRGCRRMPQYRHGGIERLIALMTFGEVLSFNFAYATIGTLGRVISMKSMKAV
jgi:hypothetical protein